MAGQTEAAESHDDVSPDPAARSPPCTAHPSNTYNQRGGDTMTPTTLINLSTGLEDAERVTIAFLVGQAALARGQRVAMWLTKEAVRLAIPGHAQAVACDGCPPLARLVEQYAESGGELLTCPICFNARKLDPGDLLSNARLAGATPMLDWIGDDAPSIFSY